MLCRTLWRLRFDCRACSVHLLPGRLARTQLTAQRFMESARSGVDTGAVRLTMVTLDRRPFDITTSVSGSDAAVYSPAVLRLAGEKPVTTRYG